MPAVQALIADVTHAAAVRLCDHPGLAAREQSYALVAELALVTEICLRVYVLELSRAHTNHELVIKGSDVARFAWAGNGRVAHELSEAFEGEGRELDNEYLRQGFSAIPSQILLEPDYRMSHAWSNRIDWLTVTAKLNI